jgi:tetratricopeptide (TPR) repeat protein
MAPEQLAAFQDGTCPGDQRSDLYSFGIILYELLIGCHPFAMPRGILPEVIRKLRADRSRTPDLRRWNPSISPGVESIVRHCLEPEPALRYQSAAELEEDLRRQLESRPLKYAPEPSLGERARKWTRRYPRLATSASVGLVAALLLLVLAAAFLLRGHHLALVTAEKQFQQARLKAVAALDLLRGQVRTIEVLFGCDLPDSAIEQREEGLALARQIVDQYRILETPAWQETALVSALAPAQREELRWQLGELLLLLAGAVARQDDTTMALRLNGLAAGCYSSDGIPKAIWRQRAELALSVGDHDEARRLRERADATSAQTPQDRYLLLLTDYLQRGRLPEALAVLREAARQEKDSFSVWLLMGKCYADLGQLDDAVFCFDVASRLWPEALWPYLCRGLACLQLRDYRKARTAFDNAIRLSPENRLALYNRALVAFNLGDLSGAKADLTKLLTDSKPPLRAYFLRARIRAREGDREGARRDVEDGLRGEPRDERDWTARGLARHQHDPRGALADYESALKVNPRYRTALQNKANVLSDGLGRTDEAIAALDALLTHHPDDVPARAGRGVLLARAGRREAAHADARETLQRDKKPFTVYQIAGVYALTFRQNPNDLREAIRLLDSAFSRGCGLDLIAKDHDLDAIRDQPEFRRLVAVARSRTADGTSQADRQQDELSRIGAETAKKKSARQEKLP